MMLMLNILFYSSFQSHICICHPVKWESRLLRYKMCQLKKNMSMVVFLYYNILQMLRFFFRIRLQCSGCVYPMNTKNVLNIAFVIRHKQEPLTLGCTKCTEQYISQLNYVFKIYKYKRGIFSI